MWRNDISFSRKKSRIQWSTPISNLCSLQLYFWNKILVFNQCHTCFDFIFTQKYYFSCLPIVLTLFCKRNSSILHSSTSKMCLIFTGCHWYANNHIRLNPPPKHEWTEACMKEIGAWGLIKSMSARFFENGLLMSKPQISSYRGRLAHDEQQRKLIPQRPLLILQTPPVLSTPGVHRKWFKQRK